MMLVVCGGCVVMLNEDGACVMMPNSGDGVW